MEENMMPQTRESERQLNEWIEQTRDNENAVLMNAENLLETLTDWRTVMTPGFCVCRALQTHYPEILEGLDCPDLKQLDHSNGWSATVCRKVARRLEEEPNIGPLHDAAWGTVLRRGYTESRVGSKSEIYKMATVFHLTDEEIDRLFMLYSQSWNPHNLLDAVFLAMRRHYRDNLTWQNVMEVLKGFLSQTNGTRNAAAGTESGGTQALLRMVDTVPDTEESRAGDSAFIAKLVEELVKNASSFDRVTLSETDRTDPLSGHYVSSYTREYTRTASLALKGLLQALVLLFPKDPPYVLTEDGLPEKLAALFNEMYAYVGTHVNDSSEEHMAQEDAAMEETLRAYLNGRLQSLPNEVSQTLRPLHGAEPTNRVLDHDGILLLGWFMILAARFNEENWEKLVEYEKEHEEDPDADLFTKKSGKLLREIARIDNSSAPKEQMEHMVKALNDLLSIFEQAGLKGIGRVYLARMMDRLVVATMLYASTRNDISKNMDLVEALLHPETC
mgnify:FL=1